jgi:hypothetical protein
MMDQKMRKYLSRVIGLVVAVTCIFILNLTVNSSRGLRETGLFQRFLPGTVDAQITNPPRFFTYLPIVSKPAEAQTGPDIYTSSYYMKTIDPAAAYTLGCTLGQRDKGLAGMQDNVVILDYGPPRFVNNFYGTKLFSAGYASTDQIAASAESFAKGYYICTDTDTQSHLTVGIGTNNYNYDGCTICAVNAAHGKAWGQMVNSVNTWLVDNGFSSQTSAAGANDLELSWSSYDESKDWLDGYDAVNQYELLNFGALPGCPYFASPNAHCGSSPNLWTKEQAWYVIWGAKPVMPIPEIYLNNGINAQQWYLMSVYAYDTHGLAIGFAGVMTQYQSCVQRSSDPECPYLDNTPLEGWTQLSTLLNGNAHTAQKIPWVTDIKWYGE